MSPPPPIIDWGGGTALSGLSRINEVALPRSRKSEEEGDGKGW